MTPSIFRHMTGGIAHSLPHEASCTLKSKSPLVFSAGCGGACVAILGFVFVVVAAAKLAQADALVVTRAMQASTIAEIFVEETNVRVELEVGQADLVAFANLLPDEICQRLTGRTTPLKERLDQFFHQDWIVTADSVPLHGQLASIVPGRRMARDEVTGEPLTDQPEATEVVIRVELNYPLQERPRTLSIRPPLIDDKATANIGFMGYHNSLPINDFRYLSREVILDLDWGDAWYSSFRHPNLRRQFNAPVSAYLYVEPYEVRKEIIVRPQDLEAWIDVQELEDGVIAVDEQPELKKRVAEFLATVNPVTIDGQSIEGRLDRIHFIHRTLRATGIIEPAVDLDATAATLGVIFVYPAKELPERVSMNWELFTPKFPAIPAVASDEAGGLPAQLTVDNSVLEWKNYLTNPTSTELMPVTRPPIGTRYSIPIGTVVCSVIALMMLAFVWSRKNNGRPVSNSVWAILVVTTVVGIGLLPFARATVANPFEEPIALPTSDAEGVLTSLLHNVYRAFDHHDDGQIYDRLEQSISGDLLSDVYLETRKSMEVKNQGGLRVSVKQVSVVELETVNDASSQPTFRCRWLVSGWIGHWGHVHRRTNEHLALITLADNEGLWKISAMEMIDEQELEPTASGSEMRDLGA